jgi:hypothetical protein
MNIEDGFKSVEPKRVAALTLEDFTNASNPCDYGLNGLIIFHVKSNQNYEI